MKNFRTIARILIPLIWAFSLISCVPTPQSERYEITESQDSLLLPVRTTAGKGIVNEISAFEAPYRTLLSSAPPAVSVKAGYYVNMQNFNTQNGLAMSSIICAFEDRDGNLWFGTSGNGLSKYNGKSFTNFTSNHGLIHNYISTIYQDSEGNMWFGTYGGVSRYDGVSFVNFTVSDGLSDNDVISICEDRNGVILIGTVKGICRSIETHEPTAKNQQVFEEIPSSPEAAISEIWVDKDNQLWCAGESGIWLFSKGAAIPNKFHDYSVILGLDGRSLDALCTDDSGRIWIGTNDELFCFSSSNPDTADSSYERLRLTGDLANEKIHCLTADSKGNIWVGTGNGVTRYDPKSKTFINFTVSQGLSNKWVNTITEDNSGSIWFGTLGGGVDRYNGESIIEYTGKQGLPGNAIYAIERDSAGNMWFAPSNGGIVKYNLNTNSGYSGTFTIFSTDQGLSSNTMLASAKDNYGNLYFAGEKGLTKFNGKEILCFNREQGLPDNYITDLYLDKGGNLWIGTYEGGLSMYDGESFTNWSTPQGLVHKTVWGIYQDNDGAIWVATRGGLSRFDGKYFLNFTTEQGLPDSKLSSVIQDKQGNIIIGSWGGGVSVINKEKVDALKGSEGNYSQPIFENFSSLDGLSNDVVYQILEDSAGNIVVGTNVGFTVFENGITNENGEIDKTNVLNFNERTGYSIKDISNNNSMHLDGSGVVWAGTGDKLVRFNYGGIKTSETPLHLELESIKINNEQVSWRSISHSRKKEPKEEEVGNTAAYITDELLTFDKIRSAETIEKMSRRYSDVHFDSLTPFYSIPVNLQLPYSKNSITFEFFGVETTRPQLVKYQYMLEGYDEDWNPVTENGMATFGNIPEGDYTFMVKSLSPDGVWSDPLTYSFRIMSPWYRSYYAYAVYVLFFAVILYFIDRFQRNRVLFQERQKTMQLELDHAKEIEKAYTDLKSTQLQLIHAEKMASLGTLTTGIAHEIQNPLNFVNNFSEVSKEMLDDLKEELASNNYENLQETVDDVHLNLQKINQHGKRADAIVKGMLQHGRLGSGVKQSTDLNAICEEFLNLAYHGFRSKEKTFNAILETDFDQNIGKIIAIPQDLGRLILNLINNAIYACNVKLQQVSTIDKADPYQPVVKIITKLHSEESLKWANVQAKTIKEKLTQEYVEISVSDNGMGISKSIMDKIFQPFFSTKPSGEGTGLGLSLSFDIVKVHDGEWEVETEEGVGTTFTVLLPLIR